MRVTGPIGVLVMQPMRGNPEDGPAFKGERTADSQEILHPPGSFVATMGEQAMVTHSDAQAPGNPPQQHGEQKGFPTEKEQGHNRANVECNHKKGCKPHDGLLKRLVTRQVP
jgi:hypothetical protein